MSYNHDPYHADFFIHWMIIIFAVLCVVCLVYDIMGFIVYGVRWLFSFVKGLF